MQVFWDILVSFFAAAGLLSLGRLLFGKLFSPLGAGRKTPIYVILRAVEEGALLEQTVKGLIWLSKEESAPLRIVITNDGADEYAREAVLRMADRWPQVSYCPLEALPDYIGTLG